MEVQKERLIEWLMQEGKKKRESMSSTSVNRVSSVNPPPYDSSDRLDSKRERERVVSILFIDSSFVVSPASIQGQEEEAENEW